MATPTIAERLIAALSLEGWTVQGTQGAYTKLTKPANSGALFIGRNGALRYGSAPSSSRSLTDTKMYNRLLGRSGKPLLGISLKPTEKGE